MYDRRIFLHGKLKPLIAGSAAVIAGNEYLAKYARRWSGNVRVVPTIVDTEAYRSAKRSHASMPVIGWIGSPSTWPYVRPILPILADLCREGRARVLIVGAGRAAETDRFEGMELRNWAEEREIEDVQGMDIGIMPLPDEPWARGKCGYKLIQYMACGLPVVASPVGVNERIVEEGMSGYLATSLGEWRQALGELLADREKRLRCGAYGRERVVRDYSLQAQSARVVRVFLEVAGR
jgi:glycosyltransferase involved in cell wall biosynthesis